MPDFSVQTSELDRMLGLLHAVSLSQQAVNAPGLELTYVHPHACEQMQHVLCVGAQRSDDVMRHAHDRAGTVFTSHSGVFALSQFHTWVGATNVKKVADQNSEWFVLLHKGLVANMMSLSQPQC